MPMLLQLLFTTGLLFTPGFASTPLECTCTGSHGAAHQWCDGCCTDPSGILDEKSLYKPNTSSAVGTCATKDKPTASTDPRVFGPTLWRAFHMIAANFPSPPTKAAHQACVAFIMALPYLVPCRHCAWDLGEFIKRNIENDNHTNTSGCFGFSNETLDFTERCESPERACMSTYKLTSFFARAHNNVNSHTNPCRKPYTTEEALDQYLAAPDGTCFHNTVWGSKQLCTGPYCNTTLPPGTSRYGTSCYQVGSDSTNFSGTGCPFNSISGTFDCPDLVHSLYYGTDSTCDNATAEACGTVHCQRDGLAPQASPKLEAVAATVAPAPVLFKHKLALLKRELGIEPATPAIPAVAEANQQMGITPSAGESLGLQLDRLLAIISS